MQGVGTHLAKLKDIPLEERMLAFRRLVVYGLLDPQDDDYWRCVELVFDPGDTSGRIAEE